MVTIMSTAGADGGGSTGVSEDSNQIVMVVDSPSDGLSVVSDDDNFPSSPGSVSEEGTAAMGDEVTAQLSSVGLVVVSTKKRRRTHTFETNPSIRKRQQNRLLKKLRQIINEFATRVGQQAVVLVAVPGKPNTDYKVFGTKPLQDVIKNLKTMIMKELETALDQQTPAPVQENSSLFELPPLIIDGIPTPVDKMTQAQLRAFIPLMLKYSTGRGKPGWGRASTRPPWWPKELPWANVRMDARSDEEKQNLQVSWTQALRQVIINCYKYHGREDLLPVFNEDEEEEIATQYTAFHAITNPDGTVTVLQIDPNNPIITLPDGTTAYVQGLAMIQPTQEDCSVDMVDMNSLTEAPLNQNNQFILTSEDGYSVSTSAVINVPIYQTMVANIPTNTDGNIYVTPMVSVPKVELNDCLEDIETSTITNQTN